MNHGFLLLKRHIYYFTWHRWNNLVLNIGYTYISKYLYTDSGPRLPNTHLKEESKLNSKMQTSKQGLQENHLKEKSGTFKTQRIKVTEKGTLAV